MRSWKRVEVSYPDRVSFIITRSLVQEQSVLFSRIGNVFKFSVLIVLQSEARVRKLAAFWSDQPAVQFPPLDLSPGVRVWSHLSPVWLLRRPD